MEDNHRCQWHQAFYKDKCQPSSAIKGNRPTYAFGIQTLMQSPWNFKLSSWSIETQYHMFVGALSVLCHSIQNLQFSSWLLSPSRMYLFKEPTKSQHYVTRSYLPAKISSADRALSFWEGRPACLSVSGRTSTSAAVHPLQGSSRGIVISQDSPFVSLL